MTRMLRPRPLMLAALAIGSFAGHQVHAAAQSQVSLGNYQYTLTDLDPSDGIAPSIVWGQGTLRQTLNGSISDGVSPGGGPNATGSSNVSQSYEVPIGTAKSLSYQGYTVTSGAGGLTVSANIASGGGTWSLLG